MEVEVREGSGPPIAKDGFESTKIARISRPHPPARRKSPVNALDAEAKARQLHEQQAIQQYGRGKKVNAGAIKDKKLRASMKALEAKNKQAALRLKDAELLLENDAGFLQPEGEMERTYRVRQDEIRQDVDVETAKKGKFELRLDQMGPYEAEYSRNGRQLLLFGRKGHVSSINWRTGNLGFELQLGETIRDAKFLHTENMVAVAQKTCVCLDFVIRKYVTNSRNQERICV